MPQQTAIQSFWNKIALQLSAEQIDKFLPEFEQAKQMYDKEILNCYWEGYDEGLGDRECE